MFYIGHFSLDELGWDNEQRHGYLTCVVTAESADDAMVEFERQIREMQAQDDHYTGWQAVYIEDLVELAEIPTRSIITRYQSSSGEFPRSISHTLPMSEGPDRVAYGHKADVDRLAEEEDSRYSEMTPFITF